MRLQGSFSPGSTLRSAPEQKARGTVDFSTRQRVECSLRMFSTASRSSLSIWRPKAFFASGLPSDADAHQALPLYSQVLHGNIVMTVKESTISRPVRPLVCVAGTEWQGLGCVFVMSNFHFHDYELWGKG